MLGDAGFSSPYTLGPNSFFFELWVAFEHFPIMGALILLAVRK